MIQSGANCMRYSDYGIGFMDFEIQVFERSHKGFGVAVLLNTIDDGGLVGRRYGFKTKTGATDVAFNKVCGFEKYKKSWLSHAPIHPAELWGKINIHGHVHDATIPDYNYYNVPLENTNGRPIAHNVIMEHFRNAVQSVDRCV